MEFSNNDQSTSSNVGVLPMSISASILPQENLSMSNANLKDDFMTIGLHNFYQSGDETQQSDELMNQNKSSTNLPIYLLTTATSMEPHTLSVADGMQLQQIQDVDEKRVENFSDNVPVPFTYYPTVSTSRPQLISLINKNTNGNSSVSTSKLDFHSRADNVLSEDLLQSFVVGGSKKLSFQGSDDLSGNIASQNLQTPKSPNQSFNVITVNDLSKDCSIQTCNLTDNSKREVIIYTDDVDKIKESTAEISAIEPADKYFQNHITGYNKMKAFESLTAEELLNSQPVLHMDFNVEAELADVSGTTLGREITTQTVPIRKPHTQKKKSANKVRKQVRNPPVTPEIKVILTTDINPDEEQDHSFQEDFMQTDDRHKCPKCALKFTESDTLDIHVKCHAENVEDKRYFCYLCGFVHTQWIKMYNHLFSHGIKKPFHCDQCIFSCISKSDLMAHAFVHSKDKVWNCPKCERLFKHQRNMKAHSRNCLGLDEFGKQKRVTTENFVCNVCQKQLLNKRNLDKHMEIHSDLRPFVCNLCGHATRLKESLLIHKRLHTGEKPYKCDVCDYSTPDKSSLRRHKRKHTNEKPYSCKFCDYKAIQKHCLDSHIHRKHTGEKFICGLCHYETYHRYALNQHFKHHHREEFQQGGTETCIVSVAPGVVISNNNEISTSGSLFLGIPNSGTNSSMENVKVTDSGGEHLQALTTDIVQDNPTDSSATTSIPTVQSVNNQPTLDVMQQIQQPGDVVYLQENGSIFIKRQDGKVLFIQQVDDDVGNDSVVLPQS